MKRCQKFDHLNPKSIGFDRQLKDYYCAKFQVIPIRGFRLIMLTYTPTHMHTHIVTRVIAISVLT